MLSLLDLAKIIMKQSITKEQGLALYVGANFV